MHDKLNVESLKNVVAGFVFTENNKSHLCFLYYSKSVLKIYCKHFFKILYEPFFIFVLINNMLSYFSSLFIIWVPLTLKSFD